MTDVELLGRLSYEDAYDLQLELVARRHRDEIADRLLLLEHDAVFTCGRATDAASLPRVGDTPILKTNRGGNVTWHGPGQIVGYWIRKLREGERDLHAHLRLIESTLSAVLADFGLSCRRDPEATGVWVGPKKVASIGVAVKNWVTYHGFALNVDVDDQVWQRFQPCGLSGQVMSDLSTLLGRKLGMDEILPSLSTAFRKL